MIEREKKENWRKRDRKRKNERERHTQTEKEKRKNENLNDFSLQIYYLSKADFCVGITNYITKYNYFV